MANVEILNHDGIDCFVMFFINKITTYWLFFYDYKQKQCWGQAKYKAF